MSEERNQGNCVAILTLPLPSISRCTHSSSSSSPDNAICGTPTWLGKGLTCVCFKRKGIYERICTNLSPLQEERLKRLKHRMKVQFDASRAEHRVIREDDCSAKKFKQVWDLRNCQNWEDRVEKEKDGGVCSLFGNFQQLRIQAILYVLYVC